MLDLPAFLIVAEGLGVAALVGDRADFPHPVIGVADGATVGVTNSIDTKGYFLLISIFNENETKKKIKKLLGNGQTYFIIFAIWFYPNSRAIPKTEDSVLISKYFRCSTNYLSDLTNINL